MAVVRAMQILRVPPRRMRRKATPEVREVQMLQPVTAVAVAAPEVPVARVRVRRLLELLALVGSENNRPLPARPATTLAAVPEDAGNPARWVLRVPEAVEPEQTEMV